jgi:hypothetical protein
MTVNTMVNVFERTHYLTVDANSVDFPAAIAAPHCATPSFHTARNQPRSAESFTLGIAKNRFCASSDKKPIRLSAE